MRCRLAHLSLVLASAVTAACGSTVSNVAPTAVTIGVGDLPGGGTSNPGGGGEWSVRTTVPLAPEERLGNFVDGNRVIMLGDSVMASTAQRYSNDMCKALVPLGWQVEVDAESGRFVQWGNFVLDYRLDAGWDIGVVLLGNNFGGNLEYFREQLTRIVERLSPAKVVLLTVTEFDPSRVDLNDVIFDIAVGNPDVYVLDWASVTGADPLLTGEDGLHLSVEGRERLAREISLVLGDAPSGSGKCLPTEFADDSMGPVTGPNDTIDTTPSDTGLPTDTTIDGSSTSTPENTTGSGGSGNGRGP